MEAFLSAGDEEVKRDDFQPVIACIGRPGSIRSELGGSGFEVGIWIVEVHGGSEEDFGDHPSRTGKRQVGALEQDPNEKI